LTQKRQGCVAGALGELAAVPVGNEPVMMVNGLRQAQNDLQQALEVGGGVEIPAADYMGHALHGVVDNDGQVITRRDVLAQDYGITPTLRTGLDDLGGPLFVELGKGQRPAAKPPPRRPG
jgi:hypothetical protein